MTNPAITPAAAAALRSRIAADQDIKPRPNVTDMSAAANKAASAKETPTSEIRNRSRLSIFHDGNGHMRIATGTSSFPLVASDRVQVVQLNSDGSGRVELVLQADEIVMGRSRRRGPRKEAKSNV